MTTDSKSTQYKIVKIVNPPPKEKKEPEHYCSQPGYWKRRKLNIGVGSVVECNCGKTYKWGTRRNKYGEDIGLGWILL